MNQIKRIKQLITGKNSKPFFKTLSKLENLTSYYSLSNKNFKKYYFSCFYYKKKSLVKLNTIL